MILIFVVIFYNLQLIKLQLEHKVLYQLMQKSLFFLLRKLYKLLINGIDFTFSFNGTAIYTSAIPSSPVLFVNLDSNLNYPKSFTLSSGSSLQYCQKMFF